MVDLKLLFEEARRTGELGPLVDVVPCARFLGLVLEPADGGLRARLDFRPELVGNATLPALHGGVLGTLLESAAIYALLWETPAATVPKTVSLTIEFLHPARAQTTWARSEVSRQGRRVATVRAVAWQDDPGRPVAIASAHLLLRPEP
jgi:uncharacterized protein (TIGR00369 family)